MAFNMKAPPVLDDDSYETWKRDIEIWSKFTDVKPEKQGLGVYLTLSGRAHSAASEIPVADLEKAVGLQTIISKLDNLFLAEKGRRQFCAFNNLYNFRCAGDMSVGKFVTDFEHVYFKFEQQDMKLPDTVMAFMLLAACNLNEEDSKLVMSATTEISYSNMKSALKRIFPDKTGSSTVSGVSHVPVKSEPVFYGDDSETGGDAAPVMYARGGRRGGRPWRGGRGARGRPPLSGANRQPVRGGRRTNPPDWDGNPTRCLICDSKFHWIRQCPDAHENRGDHDEAEKSEETVHLSLFMGYASADKGSKLPSLVEESQGFAVLDTGCTNTVCGAAWYETYVNGLSNFDRSKLVEQDSTSTFTFGDGATVSSNKKVTLPCYIGGKRSTITTEVVDCHIPLLLSNKAMRAARMALNFENDTVVISGKAIRLQSSKSGHYLLPIAF